MERNGLSVLTFTALFPSRAFPRKGVFVKHRVAAVARLLGEPARVVSPVPYFPRVSGFGRWSQMAQHPSEEDLEGIRIWHPRYFLLPKVGMPFHGLGMYWGSLKLVRRLHREHGFGILDAHFAYPDGLAAVLLGRRLGMPVVLTIRGSDINLSSRFATIRPMISFVLRQASAVIAVSRSLADGARALGAPPERVRVVRNGVDTRVFRWRPQREARSLLGLSVRGTLVLSVGNLVQTKGFDLALHALSGMKEEGKGIRYAVVGEGPLRKPLERLAERMGVQDRVRFLGEVPQDRLALWYCASDLVCIPSRREGTPNVLLEALACGAPVVASRVDGIPEVMRSGEDGLLCDPEDVPGLRTALRTALGTRWDREAIAQRHAGRGWEATARETLAIFEEVHRTWRGLSERSRRLPGLPGTP